MSDKYNKGGSNKNFLLDLTEDGGPVELPEADANIMTIDPDTPGRVVEAGMEATGRWTKEEHEAFLSALRIFGKEWKKVASKVKTRTVVQTRTHAQKYFQKLQKVKEYTGKDDIPFVNMGVEAEYKERSRVPSARKRKPSSVASYDSGEDSPPMMKVVGRRSSSGTLSAAEMISKLSDQKAPQAPSYPQQHGWLASAIKITAPEPTYANQFPEPSPAATGKRKLQEIAAARMLVGASIGLDEDRTPTPPPNLSHAPPPPLFGGEGPPSTTKKPLSLQIVNPDLLPGSDRKRRSGSPSTPWEGDMEALLSQGSTVSTAKRENMYGTDNAELPVCGPPTGYNRSKLHQAVCEMELSVFRLELNNAAEHQSELISAKDDAGYSPLHSVAALKLKYPLKSETTHEFAKLLLAAGARVSQPDAQGNTPLHWAARSGDIGVARSLLYNNAHLDQKNNHGETPMHWAMRAGPIGEEVVAFLLQNGVKGIVLSNSFRRPLDVAAEGFLDEENSLATLRKKESEGHRVRKDLQRTLRDTAYFRREARANFLLRAEQARTLVLHHPECLDHHPKSDADWEAPDRVISIMNRVLPRSDPTGNTEMSGIFPHEVIVSTDFERAKLDLLRRVHTTEYLSFVNDLSKDLEKQMKENGSLKMDDSDAGFNPAPPVVPFTPMVQRSMIKINESEVKKGMHSDTSFSAGSLKAARRAAGAVQHAVDCVLVGRNRNAFCIVRPPGHHAGTTGLLEGGESCGFCIFNNIAAGALYAISEDRLLCERCAIVDLDVHHGNGTEEIIRKYHDPKKLFFFSIHLYDNDRRKRGGNSTGYQFYPGTGSEDDLPLNIINVPITPLWKEKNGSTSQDSGRAHNTRQKSRAPSPQNEGSDGEKDTSPNSDEQSESGSTTFSQSSPRATNVSGRLAYRQAIQNRLLPSLRAFNPDLILISAGFDAARGDVGNARHDRSGRERMGIDLDPEDYAWTTRKILEVADICCQGRVVSVLEGGYGRPQRQEGAKGLDRSQFAECAVRHLHAMIDPYDTEQRFQSS